MAATGPGSVPGSACSRGNGAGCLAVESDTPPTGTTPMTDIIDLETTYEQLRKSGPRMHQTLIARPGERPGLVGRADEMALISGLIGRTIAGSDGAVMLNGDAGVRKSTL